MAKGHSSKRKSGVTVEGKWLPMSITFLKSRACAELSPHAAKLLLDLLAKLGANGFGNGDLSIAPREMRVRGWTSRQTLGDAVRELLAHGLLVQTHQGSRLDCSLFALSLFPLQCDLQKLDVGPGCYSVRDYEKSGLNPPHESDPANWRRARKTLFDTPPRDEVGSNRPATGHLLRLPVCIGCLSWLFGCPEARIADPDWPTAAPCPTGDPPGWICRGPV